MKVNFGLRILSIVLAISVWLTVVPITTYATETTVEELYIQSVQLTQADSPEEAKAILEAEGYIFLEANLNEGTGEDGIWMGYKTTSDPTEAIYDMKLMNMNGGFTLTSMEEALSAQTDTFAQMATDLGYLMAEFAQAYEEESIAAQKAYKTLNFFRMVDGETELKEENGLGYHIVNGKLSLSQLTEMLLLCDPTLVESVIKILTTGIQIHNGNWIKKLSDMGPYDKDTTYYDDEDEEEFKRRADELLTVLQMYSQSYNAMDLSGLIPDDLDENFEAEYSGNEEKENLSAEDAAAKKMDEGRYKYYKVVFDEFAKYSYGPTETLKDFFCALENEGSSKDLYPLVSVLSDGEFAAMSYGCFLEVAGGAFATSADFDTYDEVYASFTQEVQSVYLYHGVDKVLLNQDAIIGFTEEASRHMASTGELDFYEKEATAEATWETGKRVATLVGGIGLAAVAVSKIVTGVAMGVLTVATAVESVAVTKSAVLLGIIKYGSMLGGLPAMLVVAAVTAVVALGFLIASVIIDEISGKINWEENPMPEYLYDVQEVSFSQSSTNGGIATGFIQKPVFKLYQAVKDCDGQVVDLNARSKDALQWLALYVSYDRQGADAKPIKAEDILVQTGDGVTPEDYVPLARFGEVVACNLNTWDEDDDVNGVYVFYKQDQTVSVASGKTYYIYDVYLQTGESDTHCIELLEAAGYTPLNINLSPSLTDDDVVFQDKVYTYIGYKTTTNKSSAIRDIRVVYGPAQGQIQLGAATYADCGSNGQVTLYATKYDTAGTALLAGGLICVDDAGKAPKGHEPVCAMSGGPAVSFNADSVGNVYPMTTQTLLYFLPETTFTSGTKYISDIAILYYNEFNPTNKPPVGNVPSLPSSVDNYWKDYKTLGGLVKADTERVAYYTTYNPYRAIYDVKAALEEDLPTTFTFEGLGYVVWNKITCTYIPANPNFTAEYGTYEPILEDDMNGTLYVSGNPDGENVHVTDSNAMSKVQPLKASDILCDAVPKDKKAEYTAPTIPDNFSPVTNIFSNSKEAAELIMDRGQYKFKFYIAKSQTERKYISGVYALDALTLFRAYGGYESGIEAIDIPESSVLAQLANQGATNFCDATIAINNTANRAYSYLKFAYKRTDTVDEALRDVFLYFNGFNTDTPPKEMYRGNVKYTLICEIPYNLTAYGELPKPGIYLYGTTNKKAGNPITELEISDCPFFDGYQTVRTYNGRSLWSEIYDYAAQQAAIHPITSLLTWDGADLYKELMEFFEFSSTDQGDPQENGNFYIHVKREGDSLEKQKPYVGKIYLSSRYFHVYENATEGEIRNPVYNDLFDQGAEAVVTVDLNEGAGGDVVCLGYSFTADPAEAITDMWAYHSKNPPATLTKNGITYTLVKDLDLNVDAGGDYIYLYATTDAAAGKPIVSLSADYDVNTGNGTKTWVDGTQIATTTKCVKRWGSNSYSDLNRKAGGEYVYLMFTSVDSSTGGTYKAPNYGKDKTYSRSGYTSKKADGKYVGGLYVMDKNTILQEKIAAGTLPKGSTCDQITKDEVMARLEKMGATTILDTPILTTGSNYYKNNKNEVYIGYSRTDTLKQALRGIALKAVVTSEGEPPETMDTDDGSYKLVAESASGVTTLPRAVNLIGVDNCQDLMLPRLYLYTSTTVANDPIYDISIDDIPLKNGWLTARSGNNLNPFADISAQAEALADMAFKDNNEQPSYQSNVYSLDLYFLFSEFAEDFNPAEEVISTFYIHTKHYVNTTLEELKPYIGEVFVAEGESRYDALAQMVQYGVDGFIDVDLNLKAGGNYVYLGYKRTADKKEAITDLVVFEGKNPDASKRLDINGKTVKYTLVNNVDLNSNAGGKYLYLYYADSENTGNPITDLRVEEATVSYLKCGVEQVTVKRAEDKKITDENIDLNKSAGGKYLYLIMTRTTDEGHNLEQTDSKEILPTCGAAGSLTGYYVCLDCDTKMEKLLETYEPTGKHTDKEGDGDHKCDVCKAKNVSAHVQGEVEQESLKKPTCVEKGSYHAVVYCVECEDELRNTVLYIDIDPDNHKDGSDADHNCDRCGKENIEDHTAAKAVKENRTEPAVGVEGSYAMVVYCKECKTKLSEEIFPIDALPGEVEEEEGSEVVGSLFGDGSVLAIVSFVVLAVAAGTLIYLRKKKPEVYGDGDSE